MKLIGALIVAVVLVVPSPVWAQCAWVLWTYDGVSPSAFATGTWRRRAPFETYQQCREDIKRHREQARTPQPAFTGTERRGESTA